MVLPSFSSDNYYGIFDLPGDELAQFVKDTNTNDFSQVKALGYFTSLTGGSMTISAVPYDVMNLHGWVTTKFIPGQISFDPISLSRPLDNVSKELHDWFLLAELNIMTNLKKNFSIAKINQTGEFEVIFDLINAIPVAIPGFSYNQFKGSSSTKFKFKIQCEEIKMIFLYGDP